MNSDKILCSVGILTFNSAKTLKKALDSVHNFSEIIICDGGSKDDTIKISKAYNCKIIKQDKRFKYADNSISDFSGVRNQMLLESTYDWFLYIDSDEYLSPEVVEEIKLVIKNNNSKNLVFAMPRKYVIKGRVIDCATTYPNYQVRFFNKKAVNKFVKKIHERIDVKGGFEKSKLKNCEYVIMPSVSDLLRKWNYYLKLEVERNKDISFLKWLNYILIQNIKSSILYLIRYLRISLLCKGNKMPFLYELLRHWYNLKLIFLTGKKFIKIK